MKYDFDSALESLSSCERPSMYNSQLCPATEASIACPIIATGAVALGVTMGISAAFRAASKGLNKVGNAMKAKYNERPNVQARKQRKYEKSQARIAAAHEDALAKRVVDGVPFPVYRQAVNSAISAHGSAVMDAYKKFAQNVKADEKKLKASNKAFEHIPSLLNINANSYADLGFSFSETYPSKSLDFLVLGAYIPSWNAEEFWEEGIAEIDDSYFASDDVKSNVKSDAKKLFISYCKKLDAIIDKHAKTFCADMKRIGFVSANYDVSHLEDEILYAAIEVDLSGEEMIKKFIQEIQGGSQ